MLTFLYLCNIRKELPNFFVRKYNYSFVFLNLSNKYYLL